MNTIKAFTLPHVGESYRSSNDRFAVYMKTEASRTTEERETCFCISDGAGSSFNSTLFAELITQYPVIYSEISFEETDIAKIQKQWDDKVKEKIESKLFSSKIEDLYKLGREAGATFVRMCFREENGEKIWEAAAMGDSVMLFIPQNQMIPQYVVSTNQDQENECKYTKSDYIFNTTPDGLLSRNKCNLTKQIKTKDIIKKGTFVFMTDALAAWVLENHNFTEERLKKLLKISSHDEFVKFISEIRDEVDVTDPQSSVSKKMGNKAEIENDDTTVMIITITDENNLFFENKCFTNFEELINKEIDDEISVLNSELKNYCEQRKCYNNKKHQLELEARKILDAEKFSIDNISDFYSNLNKLKELYKIYDNNTRNYSYKRAEFMQQMQKPNDISIKKDMSTCENYLNVLKEIQDIETNRLQDINRIEDKCLKYLNKTETDFKEFFKDDDNLFRIENDIKHLFTFQQSESKEEKLIGKIKCLEFQKYSKKKRFLNQRIGFFQKLICKFKQYWNKKR